VSVVLVAVYAVHVYYNGFYPELPKVAEKGLLEVNKDDAACRGQLNFQTPATEIMEKIVDLHHDLMFFIIVIVVFVS